MLKTGLGMFRNRITVTRSRFAVRSLTSLTRNILSKTSASSLASNAGRGGAVCLTGDEAKRENRRLRVDLAAAYREFDRLKINEGIDNHLSLMAPAADGSGEEVMLIFPYGLHWSEVTASNLVGLNAKGEVIEGEGEPNYSTGPIHFTVHRLVPEAKCLFHLHPTYLTALACLKDPTIHLLHGNMALFHNSLVYDMNYTGFAECEDEGHRLAAFLHQPGKRIVILGNHGVLASAHDVATAFHDVYYLERCCQFQVTAMSTGKELNVIGYSNFGETAESFEEKFRQPEHITPFFESVKRRLLKNSPDFAD